MPTQNYLLFITSQKTSRDHSQSKWKKNTEVNHKEVEWEGAD